MPALNVKPDHQPNTRLPVTVNDGEIMVSALRGLRGRDVTVVLDLDSARWLVNDLTNAIKREDERLERQRAFEAEFGDRSRYSVYRELKRGRPPRTPQPCGTYPAAARHKRKGEDLDAACAVALAEYQAKMYQRRKARKRAS